MSASSQKLTSAAISPRPLWPNRRNPRAVATKLSPHLTERQTSKRLQALALSGDPLGFLQDNRRSHNASRARAVIHLNPDIHIRGTFDPADSGSSLTERIATRSSLVREPAPCLAFDKFPILLPVEKELAIGPSFLRLLNLKNVPWLLSENRSTNLAIPRQKFRISRQRPTLFLMSYSAVRSIGVDGDSLSHATAPG
jgi:hypothetical protein